MPWRSLGWGAVDRIAARRQDCGADVLLRSCRVRTLPPREHYGARVPRCCCRPVLCFRLPDVETIRFELAFEATHSSLDTAVRYVYQSCVQSQSGVCGEVQNTSRTIPGLRPCNPSIVSPPCHMASPQRILRRFFFRRAVPGGVPLASLAKQPQDPIVGDCVVQRGRPTEAER